MRLRFFEKFEGKLEAYNGNLARAAVELAKEWRSDQVLCKLEAMLIVMNKEQMFLVSGTGEVIEPDDDILAIGSGGNFALSAGRALKRYSEEKSAAEIAQAALEIAGEICVFTRIDQITCGDIGGVMMEANLTQKQIVAQLDRYIIGQQNAKRSVAVALRNQVIAACELDSELRDEITPKIF